MCFQCFTDAKGLGQIVPGVELMVAQQDDQFGDTWLKGEYALVMTNDPEVVLAGMTKKDFYETHAESVFELQVGEQVAEAMQYNHHFGKLMEPLVGTGLGTRVIGARTIQAIKDLTTD